MRLFQSKAKLLSIVITFLCLAMSLNANATDPLVKAVTNAETKLGARIGLAVHDLETDQRWEYKSNERFALSSTFKTLACANVLYKADLGQERMDRFIRFSKSNLVEYSPMTEKYVGKTEMSLSELCQPVITQRLILFYKLLGGLRL